MISISKRANAYFLYIDQDVESYKTIDEVLQRIGSLLAGKEGLLVDVKCEWLCLQPSFTFIEHDN